MPGFLLDVKNLRVAFAGGDGAAEVVSGISFALRPGEVLALVGESGCGKSSACLALTGLLGGKSRSSGTALFDDGSGKVCDLFRISSRRMRGIRGSGIAYIFQEPGASLNPVLKVKEQIAEVIRLHRRDVKDTDAEIVRLLAQVGIPDPARRMEAYPHELSGGMQQRVMIAMALAGRPRLLVADEPTTALDVTIQAQILELLNDLRSSGEMALLLISHNLGVVASLADRIAVMYAGKIVESGTVSRVLGQPQHPYTRVLLAAVPKLGGTAGKLQTIPGFVPPPGQYPAGCRFAPRCAECMDICTACAPELRPCGDGHFAACHLNNGERS